MMSSPFSIARLPRIEFGSGTCAKLPALASQFGKQVLLVTGARSFRRTSQWKQLTDGLGRHGCQYQTFSVSGEPSPGLVDDAVATFRNGHVSVVIGIGGGSVLDAAKAIAGLLKPGNSVMDHLEGVGPELPYRGPSTPFIAVPTTAGTGSEATKNAVLSIQGKEGFKKSFRDEQLVPEYAVVDPDLLAGCPPELIAANGMDAFTQLLESYVSSKANPFTDALAESGMAAVRDGLMAWYRNDGDATLGRQRMAYAALLSGITLAQVGLGSVHGLASPLGAFFPISHGVVCGTLVAAATSANIAAMAQREPDNAALEKYAQAGRLLSNQPGLQTDTACEALIDTIEQWTRRLKLPRLGKYGIGEQDFPHIVANCRGSSMKTNPIVLTDGEVTAILQRRL
jgi:alcohol dehydrogenase class IV